MKSANRRRETRDNGSASKAKPQTQIPEGKPGASTKPKRSRGFDRPFCIAGHEWIPHQWLVDFPPGSIVKDNGPGKWALLRTGGERRHHKTVFELAGEGNPEAIGQLVRQTIEGCQVLRQLAETKPDLVRAYIRKGWKWPVLMSLHPHLCDDWKQMLTALEQGEDTPIFIDRSSKWKPDGAHRIALDLLFYLWGRRAAQRSPDEKPTRLDKLADKLPEFSRDTAPEWWAVAQRALLFTYPEPEQITELADLVTADSHKTSPGVIRFRIRKILKERFSALAPL